MVYFLFEKGFSFETRSKKDLYPIHIASKYGHLDVIKFLWLSGVDLTRMTKNGMMPIHYAVLHGKKDVYEFYLKLNINLDSSNSVNVSFYFPIIYIISLSERIIMKYCCFSLKRKSPRIQLQKGIIPYMKPQNPRATTYSDYY